MEVTGKIYKLIDTRNNNILYIGSTTQKLSNRMSDHSKRIRNPNKYKNKKLYEKLNKQIGRAHV